MRLVCPNCAAQYNVDDRVIPPGGRDVQCSNCGQTWFQTGAERPRVRPAGTAPGTSSEPASGPAPQPAADPVGDPAPDPAPEPATGAAVAPPRAPTGEPEPAPPAPGPAAAPAAATTDRAVRAAPSAAPPADPPTAETGAAPPRTLPVLADDGDWEDDEPIDHLPPARDAGIGPAPRPPAAGAEPTALQGRRVLDEAVLSILREEAEREARARRAESQGMEMQGELGLPAPSPAPGGRADPAAPAPRPASADGLPDVAGLTSTLAARAEDDATGPRPKGGFGLGFSLMLGLAALGLAVYLLAPQIAATMPGLAEPLAAYTASVDSLRIWLERIVAGAGTGTAGGTTAGGG